MAVVHGPAVAAEQAQHVRAVDEKDVFVAVSRSGLPRVPDDLAAFQIFGQRGEVGVEHDAVPAHQFRTEHRFHALPERSAVAECGNGGIGHEETVKDHPFDAETAQIGDVFIHRPAIQPDDIHFFRTTRCQNIAAGHFCDHINADYFNTTRSGTGAGTDEHCDNNQQMRVDYEWIASYNHNVQQKNSDGITPEGVNIGQSVLQPVYDEEKGSWEFNIVLADGNIICTDYIPNTTYTGDASTGNTTEREIPSNFEQYRVNASLRNRDSVIAYTPPANARGIAKTTISSGNVNVTMRDIIGIPVLAFTNGSTPWSGDLNYCTSVMPLNAIKIKQSDGTYKTWKLKMPLATETQVKVNSTGAVFYDGNYAEWIAACINTGTLLGNYTYIV